MCDSGLFILSHWFFYLFPNFLINKAFNKSGYLVRKKKISKAALYILGYSVLFRNTFFQFIK